MTHQAPPAAAPSGADPGRQTAQLRELLALVRAMAGDDRSGDAQEAGLDEAARVSSAYEQALPVVQRRFQAHAGETAGWATAGVEALLAAGTDAPPRAAAARLANRLEASLANMSRLLK